MKAPESIHKVVTRILGIIGLDLTQVRYATDCGMCQNVHCEEHVDNQCDCDVLDRHGYSKRQRETIVHFPSPPVPPEEPTCRVIIDGSDKSMRE